MSSNYKKYIGTQATAAGWSYLSHKVLSYFKEHGVMYPLTSDGTQDVDSSLEPVRLADAYAYMMECKKSFIYVIHRTEANWFDLDHHVKIHVLCEEVGVPADRIVYLNNDIKTEERYDEWFKKQTEYKVKINMLCYPFVLHHMGSIYKALENQGINYKIQRYNEREKLPSKKFMCLMGTTNWSRDNLWNYFLNNQDVKNDGIISYLHKDVILPNSWISGRHDTLRTSAECREHIRWGGSGPDIDNLESYYDDSYFSIIPETSTGVSITEKTSKVLYHGHPFIMFNPVVMNKENEVEESDSKTITIGALKQLREWGFETFPELFDESYDELPGRAGVGNYIRNKRWAHFVKNLDRLNKISLNEFSKLCASVYEKCVHNQKTLLDLKIPGEELFSKLKDIVESPSTWRFKLERY
jgi:hypothetical protein